MKTIRLTLLTAVLALLAGCGDHLKTGIDAYKAKDFAQAMKELQPLADKGNAEAELYVGFMYDNGEGIPVDYRQAVLWYTRAAEQGNANAQYNLGMMYANGFFVPLDMIQALKWFNLAVMGSNDPVYVSTAKQAASQVTPEQAQEAWKLATDWKEKHK
jgi:TPR repeat protein